jgi:nitrosocyanin
MKNVLLIIGIIVILSAVGFVITKSSKKLEATVQPTPPTIDSTQHTDSQANQITNTTKEFTVTGENFSFTPNKLTVNKGDTVSITFKNNEGFHDFVLDEFNIRTKQIKAGEQQTVQFIADKTGIFEFYCSVGTHRQMGMKGTLEVK